NERNDYGNVQSENNEETEDNEKSKEEENNQQYKKKIQDSIKFAEKTLKEKISNGQKARYSSVILYSKLLLSGEKKIEASLTVAKVHRCGEYRARCIRKWAEYCFEGNPIPPSYRGTLPSKSLLYDEFISARIATYLRSNKFHVNPAM
ncbi:253_t:CDS:2, partial [Diversispora eburnea]